MRRVSWVVMPGILVLASLGAAMAQNVATVSVNVSFSR